ncbi:helix-turn-helix domain-containing protein [Metapseudomonas resinovorans]|uniref:helix-turn-helix domain-containing protein n=1 Tax=Metapseudomonas resinovorans TaxID=53412 RepID=UPI003D1E4B6B
MSPGRLAEQMNLSRRRLYQVFEAQGETVSRCIQKRRLANIAQDLASRRLEHQSITHIAFKWGFSDAAHFSRAFKRQFDLSPRAFRARASARAVAGTLPGAPLPSPQ